MKTLPNFKLREGLSIINNFKTGGITTPSAMPRTIEMYKNIGIFVPKKMLINMFRKLKSVVVFLKIITTLVYQDHLISKTFLRKNGSLPQLIIS